MKAAPPRRTVWVGLTALVTAGWVGVALHGGTPSPVATDSRGAVAAAAAAALLGAGWRPAGVEAFQLGGLAMGSLTVAVAAAAGGSTPLLAAATAAAAVALVASGLRRSVPRRAGAHARLVARRDVAMLALGAGSALLAVGLVTHRAAAGRWQLPAAGADPVALVATLAGAGLVAANAHRVPRAWALVIPALLAALAAVGALDPLPAVVAAGALAVVAAARAWPPALALAALALAAAAVPATRPAAALLAAGAALVPAVGGSAATALAIPGMAEGAASLVGGGAGRPGAVLAGGAAATAVLLARGAVSRGGWAVRPDPESVPALGLAGWLVLAPGTWGWAGATMDAYDRGAAVAVATVALVAVVAGWGPRLTAAPPARPAPPAAGAVPAPRSHTLAAVAAEGRRRRVRVEARR